MHNLEVEYYDCHIHGDVTPDYDEDYTCPVCGGPVERYYKCPGCGKEKPEYEFTLDEFDLCKECFDSEIKAMEQEEHSKARQQIIDFLKECG